MTAHTGLEHLYVQNVCLLLLLLSQPEHLAEPSLKTYTQAASQQLTV